MTGDPTGWSWKWLEPVSAAGLVLAVLLFGMLKLYAINFVRGDEHMFNYMSLLILDGLVPYRDFHYSHPPLPIYLTALIFWLGGYSLLAAKLVPIFAAMSSGCHIYLLGRRGFGAVEGLIAAVLFLFTFDVLRGSSHATGVNLTLAFMMAAVYQSVLRRPVSSGVLLALGALCGVYAVPLFLMIATLTLLRSFRDATRTVAAFVSVYAVIFIILLVLTGAAVIDQVFVFNWNRAPMPYTWWEKFRHVVFLNVPLMVGFVPGIVWGLARWGLAGRVRGALDVEPRLPAAAARFARWSAPWAGDRPGFALLITTFALGYLLFYANLQVYLSYYFLLVMPFMALITAYVLVDPIRHGLKWLIFGGAHRPSGAELNDHNGRGTATAPSTKTDAWPTVVVPVLLASLALWGTIRFVHAIGDERIASRDWGVSSYTWVPSRYLSDGVNRTVRALFWVGGRDPRRPVRGIGRYLQHETRHARTIDRFVSAVRGVCRSGESLFGEYSLGPFGASVSDCRVAADLVDTNYTRILAGESTAAEWVRAVESDGLDIAIWRVPSIFARDPVMRRYVLGTFSRVLFRWRDPHMGTVELRRRR